MSPKALDQKRSMVQVDVLVDGIMGLECAIGFINQLELERDIIKSIFVRFIACSTEQRAVTGLLEDLKQALRGFECFTYHGTSLGAHAMQLDAWHTLFLRSKSPAGSRKVRLHTHFSRACPRLPQRLPCPLSILISPIASFRTT
ncbi:hypothetical protein BT63DRAFT_427379 [Microthyrium microscopicum]|uniref:Uncharacterized protein n=1 Tax=Microthyrium microscopicum TaxID=703497 RepID=A0A6A6U7M7_9PEZI|nr:hypothetical protein BT63DRAFT_427379 [Microthyrium microscopicum]